MDPRVSIATTTFMPPSEATLFFENLKAWADECLQAAKNNEPLHGADAPSFRWATSGFEMSFHFMDCHPHTHANVHGGGMEIGPIETGEKYQWRAAAKNTIILHGGEKKEEPPLVQGR